MFLSKQFTRLYEISKTLRFELKPQGKTLENLEKDGVIEKDREIEENYQEIKKYLDDLHIRFVDESLSGNLDLQILDIFYEGYTALFQDDITRKDKKLQKEFEKISKDLRKELITFFENTGNTWKEKYSFLKKGGINILTNKEVLDLLSEFCPEKEELFEKFKGFFTYFSNFNESRKNFYKDDGTASAIVTRIVDENLVTFIKNIQNFHKIEKIYPDFIEECFSEQEREIFSLDFYNSCLLQKGINKYNEVIGGMEDLSVGLNQKVNEFKQKNNHTNKKDYKLQTFTFLYKQILSKEDKESFIYTIEDDDQLFDMLGKFLERNNDKIEEAKNIIFYFLENNKDFDLKDVYFSKVAINTVSNIYFGEWNSLKSYLSGGKQDLCSFFQIKEAINSGAEKNEDIFKKEYIENGVVLGKETPYNNFLYVFKYELNKKLISIEESQIKLKHLHGEVFKKEESQIEIIKNYMDSVLDFYKMTKYFVLEKGRKQIQDIDKDMAFYEAFDQYYIDYNVWQDYNLVRNYITKQKYKTDKFKLNFSNSQFLTGWDKDKEKERFGTLFRKGGKYYLGILKKGSHTIFNDYVYNGEEEYYEKVNYKQLNNVYRQLPRLVFPLNKKLNSLEGMALEKYLEKYKLNFGFNDEIFAIKKEFDVFQEKKNVGEKFDGDKLKKLIKYYQKAVLFLYENIYNLEGIRNKEYDELGAFYDDIEKRMYSLNFSKVADSFIDGMIKSGDFYFFQIYNKDFSSYKKIGGTENIHTKYFKLLFGSDNLKDLCIKLSGGAEVFFRDKTKHLKQRKDNKGNKVLEHKRYTEDKILFHISTTLNANTGNFYRFNEFVNLYLDKNKDVKIIGVDRGEKHLAYYSVIDKNGKILEMESLNIIKSPDGREVNYLELLEKKSGDRLEGRKSWGVIESIKELKNGYISQVVHKLASLIIEHNAIIVFEDLNSGFKRGRQKIEKQIYQKLELALAKKLNYLTMKTKMDTEICGSLHGVQLVGKVSDYQDIGKYKQSGVMFYVNPAYTSATCPGCGWRKTIRFPLKGDKSSIKKVFENIDMKFINNKFHFTYIVGGEKNVTIYSNVERVWYDRKRMETMRFDVNKELIELLKGFDLDGDINIQIQKKDLDSKFLHSLYFYFKLINNIRNSDSKKSEDIISCPCCLYHSDSGLQGFMFNGDSNGAYNIARKGIILLDRISEGVEKPNLFIADKDWDDFVSE